MDKKKILITGGTGFIGKEVLKLLSRNNFKILCISRRTQKKRKNITWIKSNLNINRLNLSKIQKFRPFALIHLSWEKIPDFSKEICEKNYKDNISFLKKIEKISSIKKIIITGSCFEYEDKNSKKKENDKVNLKDYFSSTKYKIFNDVKNRFKNSSVKFAWFRIFYAYGPFQRKKSLIPYLMHSLKNKKTIEIKTPYFENDFIFTEDIAKIIKKSLKINFKNGIYNLGSGKSSKITEIIQIIEKLSKNKFIIKKNLNKKKNVFYADMSKTVKMFKFKKFTKLKIGIKKTLLKI